MPGISLKSVAHATATASSHKEASIPLDVEVLVVPKSPGHIELILVGEARLRRFQKNMREGSNTGGKKNTEPTKP